ncbi:hypothetical protein DENIS_4188 [Desulfonema ishimotonii]|uniref:Uncharacterized protein n=1 Tax=Desulfonema ishimotonii TaxID=45657 RepID=A0A401G1X0_9BACT|nr:hypothetical protein DENIS_4188 [Desulfonema ishimotonii]
MFILWDPQPGTDRRLYGSAAAALPDIRSGYKKILLFIASSGKKAPTDMEEACFNGIQWRL